MNTLRNEDGIALVTSLMFTMLALVISMALLYMVTVGARTSGQLKRYKSVLDATYGGTEIITKDLIANALAFQNQSSSFNSFLQGRMAGFSPTFSNCLQMRLNNPRTAWTGACASIDGDLHNAPDIIFPVNAATGSSFNVYSKIVDTTEWRFISFSSNAVGTPVAVSQKIAGNSERSGTNSLSKGGTIVNSTPTVPHYPFMYKIEIQGERQQSRVEKANISVQYAY
ncbi:MAG: hypothetical protein IPQ16_08355 [Geobacteraceae bacterium]|nr:hypothetical protein [Geobacteraceae bacterium]